MTNMRFSTKAIHAGQQPDPVSGAVMTPVYLTSTYVQQELGKNKGYEYSRVNNPTRDALEANIAALENGKHGMAFGSGMAAIDAIFRLLKPGDHVLVSHNVYGGTYRIGKMVWEDFGLQFDFVDTTNIPLVKRSLKKNTRMIFVETPTNPTLTLTDIRAVSELARPRGALTVVDNTFLSPVLQRPFAHGADLVVHSATKYLNGHSDVVGGAVVAAPGRTGLVQRIQSMNNLLGTSQSPHDCFLVLRGLKTLLLRMRAHEAGARAVAAYLDGHPAVARVHYPGLADHPQHALARAQQRGFGGMLSFELADGRRERVDHVLRTLRWFTLAESLGGVESLVAHPASMTHASMTPAARARAGITDGVIRLSIGVEDPDDLVTDLEQALRSLPA